jgi:hypothetical protein
MGNPKELSRVGLALRLLVAAIVLLVVALPCRTVYAAALAITPPSASVSPLGSKKFKASGGSGMGYVWSMSASPSGGSVSATGAYTAGATPSVVDVVMVVDSAANMATANVTVGAGVTVTPATVTLGPGGMQGFTATGGASPYMWSLTTNGSGAPAAISATGGAYVAGANPGTDIVTATDSLGNMGTATITVTVKTVAIGATCMSSAVCPAGATCVDSVCCTSACTGQCQACDTPGKLGTCVTITGATIGTRPPCPQSDPSNVCTAMVCDGTSATACTSFVGPTTTCGVPSCIDQIGTPGAVCEGDGGCKKVEPKPCGAYACVSGQCATTCTNSEDCSPGNFCKVETGVCTVPPPLPDAGADSGTGTGTQAVAAGSCSVGSAPRGMGLFLALLALVGTWGLFRRRRAEP